MANGLRIIPETLRSVNSTTFTGAGTFVVIGTPLQFASCLIKIVNNSTSLVTISWDGVNTHDVLPANSFTLYDVCSDAGSQRGLYVAQGIQFWASGAAGTGLVYLAAFHTSEF
jgi:hypothetical protein